MTTGRREPCFDVVGLGQCCLDALAVSPVYPAEDGKQEADRFLLQGGGPAATALVALSRLGWSTALIGRVGDDELGGQIITGLVREGVNVDHVLLRPNSTSQAALIVAVPRTGSRTITWSRGSAAELTAGETPNQLVRQARLLHLDGLMAASSLAAAQAAKKAGVPVVIDAGTLRPHSLELIEYVDHLVVSEVFCRTLYPDLGPDQAVRRLLDLGPEAAVITCGAKGAFGLDRRRPDELIHQPALTVEVVDTTGAGDAYHGGYIHGLLSGADLAGRMFLGAAVAAINCTALGGRTALPDRPGLETFLANRRS